MIIQRSYLQIVRGFLQGQLPVDDFVHDFMHQWREDCDAEWKLLKGSPTAAIQDDEFRKIVDQAFTACDCFSHDPSSKYEISEAQLRHELQALFGEVLVEAGTL